jgi:hypothetical protein
LIDLPENKMQSGRRDTVNGFLLGLVSILAIGVIGCEFETSSVTSSVSESTKPASDDVSNDQVGTTVQATSTIDMQPDPVATLSPSPSPTSTIDTKGVTRFLIDSPSTSTFTQIDYTSEQWSEVWLCSDSSIESTDLTSGGTQTCSVLTEVAGDDLRVNSTGIPNHDFESTLGCCATEQNSVWTIPLKPELSSEDPVQAPERGAVAFTVTGVAIYGPEEGPGGDAVALEYDYFEEDRQAVDLGICGGHAGPGGEYHYHYDSNCMHWHHDSQGISEYVVDLSASVVSKVVGFAFDGFPIYSTYEENSAGDAIEITSSYRLKTGEDGYGGIDDYEFKEEIGDLDECNGHFTVTPEAPNGTYHYHSTLTNGDGDLGFPYFPLCYKGIVSEDNIQTTDFGLAPPRPSNSAGERPPPR